MMHYLTFAGKSSQDFGLRISGEGTYNRPERSFTEYEVPGRNGSVIIDNGNFKNIPITYPCYIVKDLPQRVLDFANYMASFKGYQRLEDTYSREFFRLAQYQSGLDVKTAGYMNRTGTFDVVFNCKPQRFLKSGEHPIEFSAPGALFNPTHYPSLPHLRIYGTGSGTVGVGDYLITISEINEYMDIDCDLMDAYKGILNCNSSVSFNADTFAMEPGQNGITFTGDITKVVITPRFFMI